MTAQPSPFKADFGFALMILANLFPLFGVLFLGLRVFDILLVYWAESAIIGFFTIVQMLLADDDARAKVFLVPFFMFHFGLFMLVHLMFIFAFADFAGASAADVFTAAWIAQLLVFWIALFIAHAIRFIGQQTAEQKKSAGEIMFEPYGRIVTLHVTLILGFIFAFFFPPLIVLIKIVMEVVLERFWPIAIGRKNGA